MRAFAVSVIFAVLAGTTGLALSAPLRAQRSAGLCPGAAPTRIPAEQWPAARRKLAPNGPSSIRLCRYSGLNAHPALTLTHARLVTRPGVIRKLVREFEHLPREPRGPVACPADDGSEMLALLEYPRGREVKIAVHLTGCTPATNGSVTRRATQRLIAQLERLVDSQAGH